MQAVIPLYVLIKMAREGWFNLSMHQAKGDRLVRAIGYLSVIMFYMSSADFKNFFQEYY